MKPIILTLLVITLLTLCTKNEKSTEPEIFADDFGIKEFNTSKRVSVEEKRKQPISIERRVGDSGVLLIDFDGHFVSGTMFNVYGDFTVGHSGLTIEEQDSVLERVENGFSQFRIIVTDEERIFNRVSTTKRMRVVLTESWEWYGQVGGVAYLNSFTWADETPCFVFSSLLNYNLKWISDASSHELGHTLGLRHQSLYDENCNLVAAYNPGGNGSAPIMGVSYYQPKPEWIYGQDSRGCNYWQNDPEIIKSKVP